MVRRSWILLAALVLVPAWAGCLQASAPVSETPDDDAATAGGASGDDPGPGEVPDEVPRVAFEVPSFAPPVLVTTILAFNGVISQEEPLLHAGADGALYLTTPHVPALWRSDDGGATFRTLFDVRTGEGERTQGATDAAFANGPNGSLFWLGLFGGTYNVPFQVSMDRGASWSGAVELSENSAVDRQWIGALPSGPVVATWAGSMRGLEVRVSPDGGAVWGPVTVIHERSGFPGPVLAVPETGAFFIPFADGFDRSLRVARSLDGALGWTESVVVTGLQDGQPHPALSSVVEKVPVIARDAAGTLYLVYSGDDPLTETYVGSPVVARAVFLSRSFDDGATWEAPVRISAEGRNAVLPWIVAGQAGRVPVAWYEDTTGVTRMVPNPWYVTLAVSSTADQAQPVWLEAHTTEAPAHLGSVCNECGDFSRLDHLGLALAPDGTAVVAWVRDNAVNPRDLDIVVSRTLNNPVEA